MSTRIETPQETLERLQRGEGAVVTPVTGGVAEAPDEKRPGRRSRGRPRSVLRLVVTAVIGIAALLFGLTGVYAAAEMKLYGQEVTADVVRVEPIDGGHNRIYIEYPVDGAAQRSTIDERGNAPQPGESMEVVYDTRDVGQVAEAPTGLAYTLIAAFVGLGLYWIVSAVRGFRQRREFSAGQ
jgi:hypothetical protein